MKTLASIAFARSGDKGSSANIALFAYNPTGYEWLKKNLTAAQVDAYFKPLGVTHTTRYELPHLLGFNFVLEGVLAEGGSRSLRIDAQGKTLGLALLEMEVDL